MSLKIKYNSNNIFEIFTDISFFLFIITEIAFRHTLFSQFSLIMFTLSGFLLIFAKKKFFLSYFMLFMALFILYNWINIKFGVYINYVFSITLLYTLIINFVFFFILYNYVLIKAKIGDVLNIYVVATLFATIYIFGISLSTLFTERLGSTVGVNANLLSIASANAFILLLYSYIKNRKLSLVTMMSWLILIILMTGSRKGILMILIGIILLYFFLYPKNRIRILISSLILTICVYLSIIYIPQLYNIIGYRIESIINYMLYDEIEEASLASRSRFIDIGWDYFKTSYLRGYGLDSFRQLNPSNTYSHNNFIEILVSSGIIGFILYYLNYFIAIIQSNKYKRKKYDISYLMLTLITILLIMEFAMVTYYLRILLVPLIITIGCNKKISY